MNKHDIASLLCKIKMMGKMEIMFMFSLIALIVGMPITVHHVWADDHTSVPSWTKKLSHWWSQGNITDVESVNAFQYLIDNKIIYNSGMSFNRTLSFDKQIQQTRLLSSFLWNESGKTTDFKSSTNVTPSSRLHYIFVQPAPEWALYTNDLVKNATNYWKNTSDTKFVYSSDSGKASIIVRWLKEPESQYAGYAVGGMIEVALGDSRCDGMWHAYDAGFVTATLTHELGHALGFGHSKNMSDIMYPIISGEKYASIKQTFVLPRNGSIFVHVCTLSHTGTFHYAVKSSDANNSLNIFFVPSKIEYEKFIHGKKFDYYKDDGCFGTASISYDNKCFNISHNGGLIISTSNDFQLQQNVTLTMDEE